MLNKEVAVFAVPSDITDSKDKNIFTQTQFFFLIHHVANYTKYFQENSRL